VSLASRAHRANARILLLFVLALVLRATTQDWDSGLLSPHPDERRVVHNASRLGSWWDDVGDYLYGSLHFQAVRGAGALTGSASDYPDLLVGGRRLSLFASLIALALGAWLAARAWGRRTAELVVGIGAFVPLALQQSHYATVEAHHAAWVMATLAAAFWTAHARSAAACLVMGALFAASMAVKVASLPLLLPVALALWWSPGDAFSRLARGTGAAASAIIVFWLAQPWAFAGARPPLIAFAATALAAGLLARASRQASGRRGLGVAAGLALLGGAVGSLVGSDLVHRPYFEGVGAQLAMVSGRIDVPWARVYRPTLPVFYSLRELALWGLGPGLLVGALAALAFGARRLARARGRLVAGPVPASLALLALLVAWVVPTAANFATVQVKFLRYWEPLGVPLVMLTAWFLARLPVRLRRTAIALVVAPTVVCGLFYVAAFDQAHPHVTAKSWLDERIAPGETVVFEQWDEAPRIETAGKRKLRVAELRSYDLPDDWSKVRRWVATLAAADWVVLASHRVRRTVLVNADLFPLTARLYSLLLSGELGFEPVAVAERAPGMPHVPALRLPVQRADESFVNYDFPRVVVLERREALDARALLERVRSALEAPLPNPAALDRSALERVPRMRAPPGSVASPSWLRWSVITGLGLVWLLLRSGVRSSGL